MINITIKQLEVFVAIVETGSFTQAANRLFMAQSTVSGHIRTLEKELGILLFSRDSKRNIKLTEIGNRLYKSAVDILERCRSFEDEILIDKTNELTIGASTVPAACILPKILASFSHVYPEARFTVRKGDSGDMHLMLSEGEVQLAFVGSSIQHNAFQYEKIAEDRIVIITPNREPYVSYKKKGVLGRELLTHPLLFRESGSGTQKVIDDYLSQIGMEKNKLHIVGRFENSAAIVDMVSQGMGLAMISQMLLETYKYENNIIIFPLEKNPREVSRSYYMLLRKKKDYSDLQRSFIDHVKKLRRDKLL